MASESAQKCQEAFLEVLVRGGEAVRECVSSQVRAFRTRRRSLCHYVTESE